MPSKEEAEAMADAILAAARKSGGRSPRTRESSNASTSISGDDGAGTRTPWVAIMMTGILTGAIVASLPTHRIILGALVGLVIAAAIAVIARRFGR